MALVVTLPRNPTPSYSLDGVNFVSTIPVLSDDVEFIPICTLADGEVLTYKKSGKRSFLYSLKVELFCNQTHKFVDFCRNLHTNRHSSYRMETISLKHKYIATYGTILQLQEEPFEVIPLMSMCVKQRYLFELNRRNISMRHLTLVIDKKFINDEEHFKLFRNVNRLYIEEVMKHIDVLYTDDITETCFKSPKINLPKFATMQENIQYMKDINKVVAKSV